MKTNNTTAARAGSFAGRTVIQGGLRLAGFPGALGLFLRFGDERFHFRRHRLLLLEIVFREPHALELRIKFLVEAGQLVLEGAELFFLSLHVFFRECHVVAPVVGASFLACSVPNKQIRGISAHQAFLHDFPCAENKQYWHHFAFASTNIVLIH